MPEDDVGIDFTSQRAESLPEDQDAASSSSKLLEIADLDRTPVKERLVRKKEAKRTPRKEEVASSRKVNDDEASSSSSHLPEIADLIRTPVKRNWRPDPKSKARLVRKAQLFRARPLETIQTTCLVEQYLAQKQISKKMAARQKSSPEKTIISLDTEEDSDDKPIFSSQARCQDGISPNKSVSISDSDDKPIFSSNARSQKRKERPRHLRGNEKQFFSLAMCEDKIQLENIKVFPTLK